MYHNEYCNFPAEFNQKKKCDHKCKHWVTCTRKNSCVWESFTRNGTTGLDITNINRRMEGK